MHPAPVSLEESLQKLRLSVRTLDKICIKRENDLKTRQQDLFGGGKATETVESNVVQLDLSKITRKLDQTIAQVETLLQEGAQ